MTYGIVLLALLPVWQWGCGAFDAEPEPSLPVEEEDILGVWVQENSKGTCYLDIRPGGRLRQICIGKGEDPIFFDSGWTKWELERLEPVSDGAHVHLSGVMSFDDESFGKRTSMNILAYKYQDGTVVLHNGFMDFSSPRPYGTMKELSPEEVPEILKGSSRVTNP
jgi:hypothetical protein